MHDMALSIDHDIPIMSILDVQYVARNRVRSHRLDKVQTSLLKRHALWVPIFRFEESNTKIIDLGSTHLISRGSIRNDVDETALWEGKNIQYIHEHRRSKERESPPDPLVHWSVYNGAVQS